ncbi:MAG: hypothetical protein Q4B08_07075, partial [Propionibacteriaceae bacterium]|nr:hypothetical protein [Propionibacteriaceae bacterium]
RGGEVTVASELGHHPPSPVSGRNADQPDFIYTFDLSIYSNVTKIVHQAYLFFASFTASGWNWSDDGVRTADSAQQT